MSSSTRRDSTYSKTRARSPPRRSRIRDRSSGSKRSEAERLSGLEDQQRGKKSNHADDDREICAKKLSEFNESLRRQGQSTSTKFQWDHLLPDNSGKAVAAATTSKQELAVRNERTTRTYSMSPMGIVLTEENRFIDSKPPPLKETESGFSYNGEDFWYPEVGNRGVTNEAVGFSGEKLGFDSPSVIAEMARNRIRKTERVTELAYRKMERVRSGASLVDSIIDKIDAAGENRPLELDRRFSLPQQYMTGQKGEGLHGERHQPREDCSRHAFTQRYLGFSGQGEDVVGFRMNHSQSANGAFFHGAREQFEEDCGHLLPQIYPDLKEKSHGNETEQENEVLGCRMNHAQSQNGAGFNGKSQQFQYYVHLTGKSHEMEQENEDLVSSMNCQQSQKTAPLLGKRQELPEDFGYSLPQNYLYFGRESHVMEQTNDAFSPRRNRPQAQKKALLTGESQGLTEDYGHSLSQHYLDFNVESQERQPENELLGIRMKHPHKRKEATLHGEKQEPQEDGGHSLPRAYFGLSGESLVMEKENETKASRMNHPRDQKGAYFNGESLQLQQDCALESNSLPKQDDYVHTTEGRTEQISVTEEIRINSRSSKTHPKKRIIDLRKITESRISRTSDASDDEILDIGYGGEQWSDEDFEQKLLLRNSGSERPQDERATLLDELPSQRNVIDCDYQFSSPHTQEFAHPSNRKSVKQRLGPPCHGHNPYPSTRKSIKQRLGPPCHVHNPNYMPRVERHKMRKLLQENVNDFPEGVQARDVDLRHLKRGRTEPPEDSEEFEQQIHGAFVKFVKILNENPAQRRKYREKGEAGTLRCCVCGSKSEEFVNTLSLVTHAFTSRMVGLRANHLGLHKSLCFLMGWNSVAASNGLWRQKTLPDVEALALKEDLVIWPPIVILHNSSIATTNSDHRIIVSIEEIEAFLRDMGFGWGISKVCRGKPANQSIMTVIFHGTFSGLKEAERLHKLYAENKHGRAEFQQINCSSGETKKAPLDKVKDVLYGYLGIAGDLDKLDFETKSRALVKSKKEIYATADALLNIE
ncbi:XS domain - like 7 [Theobroma cacao]|nr:XS domain - like 6 [Theobroma cacao]WRX34748.1 XS domain - like 7 [Theobroma cacao]